MRGTCVNKYQEHVWRRNSSFIQEDCEDRALAEVTVDHVDGAGDHHGCEEDEVALGVCGHPLKCYVRHDGQWPLNLTMMKDGRARWGPNWQVLKQFCELQEQLVYALEVFLRSALPRVGVRNESRGYARYEYSGGQP